MIPTGNDGIIITVADLGGGGTRYVPLIFKKKVNHGLLFRKTKNKNKNPIIEAIIFSTLREISVERSFDLALLLLGVILKFVSIY